MRLLNKHIDNPRQGINRMTLIRQFDLARERLRKANREAHAAMYEFDRLGAALVTQKRRKGIGNLRKRGGVIQRFSQHDHDFFRGASERRICVVQHRLGRQ